MAATRGAMSVVDGNVLSINPGDDEKYVEIRADGKFESGRNFNPPNPIILDCVLF